jgi:hypothetical protein
MKLHFADRFGGSCGSVVLAILLNKEPAKMEHEILKYRKTHKPKDVSRRCYKQNIHNYKITYWSEIKALLSKFVKNRKTVAVKEEIKLKDLIANKLDPKNYYIVLTTSHIQIVHNKKVWDTDGMGQSIKTHLWNRCKVHYYIRLNAI